MSLKQTIIELQKEAMKNNPAKAAKAPEPEEEEETVRGIDTVVDDITFSLEKRLKHIYFSAAKALEGEEDQGRRAAIQAVLEWQLEDVFDSARNIAACALRDEVGGFCPFSAAVAGCNYIL